MRGDFKRMRDKRWIRWLAALIMALLCFSGTVYCEDEEPETEYIPEEYYAPIQSNEIPGWPQGQAVQAASAIVMDLDTGVILYAKGIYDAHYPASITKTMTALVAIENGGDLDAKFTCGEEVYDIESDSSHAGIHPGEELTLREALYGLMHESANDLGNAIAVYISGSVEAFADLMNMRAKDLGCVNTHFVNPHGLHNDDHYTCAYDMALIGQAAWNNETLRSIMGATESSIPPTNMTEETRYFANHHKMLQESSEHYVSWCRGGKTGFTQKAWNTLITFGSEDDFNLVCVMLHENGADRSYSETTDLINYGFREFTHTKARPGGEVPTFYQLMKMDLPDADPRIYRNPALKEKVLTVLKEASLTVPVGTDVSALETTGDENSFGTVNYLFGGWPVGSGQIKFNPFPQPVSYPFQEKRDKEAIYAAARAKKQEQLSSASLQEQLTVLVDETVATTKELVQENKMTIAFICGFILLVLLLVIIILIMRLTRESRMRKRRRKEERMRSLKEAEIERKSALEIEQELRAAMDAEKKRKEQQQARERQQLEENLRLRETEELLEQIGREEFSLGNPDQSRGKE